MWDGFRWGKKTCVSITHFNKRIKSLTMLCKIPGIRSALKVNISLLNDRISQVLNEFLCKATEAHKTENNIMGFSWNSLCMVLRLHLRRDYQS